MENAALVFCFLKGDSNGFFHSGQAIYTKGSKYPLHLNFSTHSRQTVSRGFVITYLNNKHFFFPCYIDSKNHICHQFSDDTVI